MKNLSKFVRLLSVFNIVLAGVLLFTFSMTYFVFDNNLLEASFSFVEAIIYLILAVFIFSNRIKKIRNTFLIISILKFISIPLNYMVNAQINISSSYLFVLLAVNLAFAYFAHIEMCEQSDKSTSRSLLLGTGFFLLFFSVIRTVDVFFISLRENTLEISLELSLIQLIRENIFYPLAVILLAVYWKISTNEESAS